MRWLRYISLICAMSLSVCCLSAQMESISADLAGAAQTVEDPVGHETETEVDVAGILFGHIGDSYGWHITDWKGKHLTIPLPCIVKSSTGWHVFMSSKVEHGHEYEGLFIAEEGRYEDKIVERKPDGTLVRPFDISITKNVCSLIFSSVLLVVLVLLCAGWYRRHGEEDKAPGGFAGLMEMLVMMVHDDIIKENAGPLTDNNIYIGKNDFMFLGAAIDGYTGKTMMSDTRLKKLSTMMNNRDEWAKETCYVYPGPIQYFGPTEVCDQTTATLALEQAK